MTLFSFSCGKIQALSNPKCVNFSFLLTPRWAIYVDVYRFELLEFMLKIYSIMICVLCAVFPVFEFDCY